MKKQNELTQQVCEVGNLNIVFKLIVRGQINFTIIKLNYSNLKIVNNFTFHFLIIISRDFQDNTKYLLLFY